MKTAELARGKWTGILKTLGVDDRFLGKKHGPCPFCEGTDRFRFDDKDGKGSFICNQCGAGDGFEFLKRYHNWDFKTSAREVERVMGHCREEKPKPKMDAGRQRELQRRLWEGGQALSGDDIVSLYLMRRNVFPNRPTNSLRLHPRCPVPNGGGFLPAMLALVSDRAGDIANIHRTFLGTNGKAEIDTPRAMMPGDIPDGSAVRLYQIHGQRLGIAEGIETAIAAAKRFKVPTWAALNSTMLEKWTPPKGVTEVMIFGDCDAAYGGQAAAYSLAHRLTVRSRLKVTVKIPEAIGKDWADSDVA